jgi:hypothetical protein
MNNPKEFLSMTDTHHGTTTQLVPVTLSGVGHTYLDQSMVPKVNAFIANAQAHGVNLHFNSAFRTPEHQERLHHDPNAITPATHSLHSAGFAVDVNYSTVNEAQREIIRTAAHDAGLSWGGNFHRRDPPHFYVEPPIDRNTAIANATRQYNELTGHHRSPVPEHHDAATHQHNALQAPPEYPAPGTSAQASPRLDEASHPDHALFQQAYAGVKKIDTERGRAPDRLSKNLAGALAVEAKSQGLKQIDSVVLSDDGSKAFAAEQPMLGVVTNVANVDTARAVNTTIEGSTQQMAQVNQALQQQSQHRAQQMAQQENQQATATQNVSCMG